MRQCYFVTAIGTDSGKTFVSAVICEALQADYWKPVQCGFPTDTDQIRKWTGGKIICHPEQYLLKTPASPHLAAEKDGIQIKLRDFICPSTSAPLVIEGAGGMLVPLNEKENVIELASQLSAEILLVCDLYLGSINHSLLSINYLKSQSLNVAGIIFNGPETPSSETIIEAAAYPWPVLLKLRPEGEVNRMTIRKYARTWARDFYSGSDSNRMRTHNDP